MIEIALVIVSLAQSGILWYVLNSQKEERAKLINAVIAKQPEDMLHLEALDKSKPQKKVSKDDILTPIDQLSDDDFSKFVLNK